MLYSTYQKQILILRCARAYRHTASSAQSGSSARDSHLFGRTVTGKARRQHNILILRRTRYYMSCIDVSILEKGTEYDELPDVTILYITKTDFIGGGRGVYQTCRKVRGTAGQPEQDWTTDSTRGIIT